MPHLDVSDNMDRTSLKHIRNAVIASVIAGIILTMIPSLRSVLIAGLEYMWIGVVWCWQSIFSTYATPVWILLILVALALFGAASLASAIWPKRTPKEYETYVEDRFYGAIWRWRWHGSQICDLWCFCHDCDATLVYDDSSCRIIMSDEHATKFICENCQRQIAQVEGGDKDYALSALRREIDRRIRTNEYSNRLQNHASDAPTSRG